MVGGLDVGTSRHRCSYEDAAFETRVERPVCIKRAREVVGTKVFEQIMGSKDVYAKFTVRLEQGEPNMGVKGSVAKQDSDTINLVGQRS